MGHSKVRIHSNFKKALVLVALSSFLTEIPDFNTLFSPMRIRRIKWVVAKP